MSAWFLTGLYRFGLLTGGLIAGFGFLGLGLYRMGKTNNPRDLLGGLAMLGAVCAMLAVIAFW